MNVKIITSRNFRKEAAPLLRKYASLQKELKLMENTLISNPYQGIPLGHNCYKIKLAIQSKGKGKRGGARIITFVARIRKPDDENILVNLASIFDKSQTESITDRHLQLIIKEIIKEIGL